jgi:hypothetical protein
MLKLAPESKRISTQQIMKTIIRRPNISNNGKPQRYIYIYIYMCVCVFKDEQKQIKIILLNLTLHLYATILSCLNYII